MCRDGDDPTPFIPYLLLPSSHWQAVDWGLRLAATFSQKAREIQFWEWMATSCYQCCNLGNRQSTILVPPLATRMVGKMYGIYSAMASNVHKCKHTHTDMHIRTKWCTQCSLAKSLVSYIQLSSLSINTKVHLRLKHVSIYGQTEIKCQAMVLKTAGM